MTSFVLSAEVIPGSYFLGGCFSVLLASYYQLIWPRTKILHSDEET